MISSETLNALNYKLIGVTVMNLKTGKLKTIRNEVLSNA